MPYWEPADNDVLTAAELQADVSDQVVSQVTSATLPSGIEGQIVEESDTDRFKAYDGTGWREIMSLGAWHSFTPTIDGVTTDPVRVNGTWQGQYVLFGNLGVFMWNFVFGSSDTFGSGEWRLVLPDSLTAENTIGWRAGHFWAVDATASSANRGMIPVLSLSDPTLIRMQVTEGATTLLSNTGPFTWASTDTLSGYAIVPLTF